MSAAGRWLRFRPGAFRALTVREEILLVVLLSSAFALFLVLSGFSPGVIQDTLNNEEMGASLAAQLRQGQRPNWREAPCFLYHGSLMGYLMLPFFYQWGTSWSLVRLWPVAGGFLTLWLTYLFVRRMFGRAAALLTAFLLVVHPSFVMGVKAGNFQVSFMLVFSVGAVLALYRWWENRRPLWLAAGMALLGLGTGTRFWFSCFVAALFASALPLAGSLKERFRGRAASHAMGTLLLAAGALILGALPVLYTEITHGMPVFEILSLEGGSRGWSWYPLAALQGLRELLDGTTFYRHYFEDLPPLSNPWFLWATVAAWFYIGRTCLRGPARTGRGPLRWLFLFGGLLFLVFTFSPKALAHHMFVVYPFPQVLIAAAAAEAARAAGGRLRAFGAAALLAVAGVAAKDGQVLAHFLGRLSAEGGLGKSSDAVYDVGRWLAPYSKGRSVFVVVPEYLATNLNLYFRDLDLKFQFDVMYPPFTTVRTAAGMEALDRVRTSGTYATLLEEVRRGADPRWNVDSAFAKDFYAAWERDLGSGTYSEAVFIGHPAADFWYTPYFFLLWCHWAELHGREVRLIQRFTERDGVRPAFEAYSMSVGASR